RARRANPRETSRTRVRGEQARGGDGGGLCAGPEGRKAILPPGCTYERLFLYWRPRGRRQSCRTPSRAGERLPGATLMKIECDKCGAKYSIADVKVRGKTFKIRCKKCSNVIIVRDKAGGA